ncbi:hypothetical protein PENSPDRAFT_694925 [Peniophora sp. CONT]|nr:hypothetical protein PENSPDRAFT_694925 [Peniophora sp. CONT]
MASPRRSSPIITSSWRKTSASNQSAWTRVRSLHKIKPPKKRKRAGTIVPARNLYHAPPPPPSLVQLPQRPGSPSCSVSGGTGGPVPANEKGANVCARKKRRRTGQSGAAQLPFASPLARGISDNLPRTRLDSPGTYFRTRALRHRALVLSLVFVLL